MASEGNLTGVVLSLHLQAFHLQGKIDKGQENNPYSLFSNSARNLIQPQGSLLRTQPNTGLHSMQNRQAAQAVHVLQTSKHTAN